MSGMDVLKALRSALAGRQIPVVVLSDKLTDQIKQNAREAGAHTCIAKPVEVRDLVDTVVCLI
jgi:DNA-binding response OmpR family regulator